jgi:hypothetical protein
MSNPYRESAAPDLAERISAARWDDYVLSVMLIVLGTIRVTLAVVNDEAFETEATLAVVMVVLGVVLGISTVARSRHSPPAR